MYMPSLIKLEGVEEYEVEDDEDVMWQDDSNVWMASSPETLENECEPEDSLQPIVVLEKLDRDEVTSWVADRPHKCGECDARFSTQDALATHTMKHAQSKPFSCPFCPGIFRFQSGLLHHACSQTSSAAPGDDDKPFTCSLCNLRFHDSETYLIHMKAHSAKQRSAPPSGQDFPCLLCKERFDHKSALLDHARVHADDSRKNIVKCALCAAQFPSRLSLRSHMRVHSRDKPHMCTKCPQRFSARSALWAHTRVHDTSRYARRFICSKCHQGFRNRKLLYVHIKAEHGIRAPAPASAATQAPTREPALSQESSSRISEWQTKPFKCWSCFRTFELKKSLVYHRTHNCHMVAKTTTVSGTQARMRVGKWFKCGKCDVRCKTRKKLWSHIKTHILKTEPGVAQRLTPALHNRANSSRTDETVNTCDISSLPSKPKGFRCSKCPKKFPDRKTHWFHYLKAHRRKPFVGPPNLAAVKKEVRDEPAKTRGYHCSKCSKFFPDRKALYAHNKILHRGSEPTTERSSNDPNSSQDKVDPKSRGYHCSKCLKFFADRKSHFVHYKTCLTGSETIPLSKNVEEQSNDPGSSQLRNYRHCSKCTEIFPDRKSHSLHFRTIHSNLEVEDPEAMKNESIEVKEYRCGKCPEVFPDRKSHRAHYKVHVGYDQSSEQSDSLQEENLEDKSDVLKTREFRCGKCSEVFADRKSHWRHYRTHTNPDQVEDAMHDPPEAKPKRYQCSKCPLVFPDRKAHRAHYKVEHTNSGSNPDQDEPIDLESVDSNNEPKSEQYPCSKCPEVFSDRRTRFAHFRLEHIVQESAPDEDEPIDVETTDEPKSIQYKCRKCPEVLSDKRSIFTHHRLEHNVAGSAPDQEDVETTDGSKSRKYQCSKCPEVLFDRKSIFAHHRLEHSIAESAPDQDDPIDVETIDEPNSKQYQCSKCPELFPDRKEHRAHLKTRHSVHMRLHRSESGAVMKATYKCKKCLERFRGKDNLYKHMKQCNATTHKSEEGLKTWKCSKCSARLSSRSGLWLHIKSHRITNKAYKCDDCDAEFNTRGGLRAHAEVHRSGPADPWTALYDVPLACSVPLVKQEKSSPIAGNTSTIEGKTSLIAEKTSPITSRSDKPEDGQPVTTEEDCVANPAGRTFKQEDLADQPSGSTVTPSEDDMPSAEDPDSDMPPPPQQSQEERVVIEGSTCETNADFQHIADTSQTDNQDGVALTKDFDPASDDIHTRDGSVACNSDELIQISNQPNSECAPVAPVDVEGPTNGVDDADGSTLKIDTSPNDSSVKEGFIPRSHNHFSKKWATKASSSGHWKTRFKCKKCDAKFKTRLGFNAHQKVHVVVKPFRCKQCEATFTSRQNLMRHMRNHLGIKPFKCSQCGETFGSIGTRQKHVVEAHPAAANEG